MPGNKPSLHPVSTASPIGFRLFEVKLDWLCVRRIFCKKTRFPWQPSRANDVSRLSSRRTWRTQTIMSVHWSMELITEATDSERRDLSTTASPGLRGKRKPYAIALDRNIRHQRRFGWLRTDYRLRYPLCSGAGYVADQAFSPSFASAARLTLPGARVVDPNLTSHRTTRWHQHDDDISTHL